MATPDDQATIPHPRIGYYGMIDERMDLALLDQVAEAQPEFQFVMLGPVVNISPDSLPKRPNIHYLGKKEYASLPLYLSGWDCALIPLEVNDRTKLANPAKTAELLAAGVPVVSTSIPDVMRPYADAKLVYIADDSRSIISAIEKAMNERAYDPEWLERVDSFLEDKSWDMTFAELASHEKELLKDRHHHKPAYMDESLSAIGIV